MKVAFRNRKKFYYALYQDKVEIVDDKGFKTGEWGTGYSEPVMAKANISPATGNSNTEQLLMIWIFQLMKIQFFG